MTYILPSNKTNFGKNLLSNDTNGYCPTKTAYFFKEVWLIYNITLVSALQHSDLKFHRLYYIQHYYKILAIFPVLYNIPL